MAHMAFERSGRKFDDGDIELIRSVVLEHPKLSRSELAATICELTGWVQANGNPKLTQCLDFLCGLAAEGIVELPATRVRGKSAMPAPDTVQGDAMGGIDDSGIAACGGIRLEMVRPGGELRRWRHYLSHYHGLGDPHVYGAQTRYMIKSDTGRDLGCLLFSAASWALSPRDGLIGWTAEDKKERLHLVVNNSRFLLLPWVHVNCLASRALSMASRRLQNDWLERYNYAPVLLETFVDVSKFRGTCYKAANWICLGETQGRGRNDRSHRQELTRKAIYVYPLQRDYISVLNGDTPCRARDPDE
jgi:hypothetical protein